MSTLLTYYFVWSLWLGQKVKGNVYNGYTGRNNSLTEVISSQNFYCYLCPNLGNLYIWHGSGVVFFYNLSGWIVKNADGVMCWHNATASASRIGSHFCKCFPRCFCYACLTGSYPSAFWPIQLDSLVLMFDILTLLEYSEWSIKILHYTKFFCGSIARAILSI